jgi:hypothetical protein
VELLYDGRTMGFGMNRFLSAVMGYDSSCLLLIGATAADDATVVVGAVVSPPRLLPRERLSGAASWQLTAAHLSLESAWRGFRWTVALWAAAPLERARGYWACDLTSSYCPQNRRRLLPEAAAVHWATAWVSLPQPPPRAETATQSAGWAWAARLRLLDSCWTTCSRRSRCAGVLSPGSGLTVTSNQGALSRACALDGTF